MNRIRLLISIMLPLFLAHCVIQKPLVTWKDYLKRVEPASPDLDAYETLDYGIAPWFRFRQMALSITFDDGTLDQYLLAFPELEAKGIKATFFVITEPRDKGYWKDHENTRLLFSWDQAREMAVAGHEIGSHSMTHARMTGNSLFVETQLLHSRIRIDQEIRSRRCISFCWPFWKSDDESRHLAERYYVAARSGWPYPSVYSYRNNGIPTANPADLLQINSFGILNQKQFLQWQQLGETVSGRGGWAVLNLHGIDDGVVEKQTLGWQALPLEAYRTLLEYVSNLDAWIAPFGRVSRYIHERRSCNLRLVSMNTRRLILELEDGLDDEIFDQALTLRLRLPEGWSDVEVEQSGQISWSSIEEEGLLLFDAFPDGSLISIERNYLFGPGSRHVIREHPRPFVWLLNDQGLFHNTRPLY
jgi:chitin deacetylase